MNGVPATGIAVYQQPGANGLTVSKLVRETMENALPLSVPLTVDIKVGDDWAAV